MATQRGPYGKHNAGDAAAFLRDMNLLGGLKKPDQVVRQANRVERQLAAGKAPNKQDARGHGNTREHPGRAAPSRPGYRELTPTPATAHPTPRLVCAGGTHHEGGAVTRLPNGDAFVRGHTKAMANFAASLAAASGTRVKASYLGTDGKWHSPGQKGGLTPAKLRDFVREHGSWAAALAAIIEYFYGEDAPEADASGETEFYLSA
ncbi:MAG: hypothetical protein IVW57_04430 [Ktedonobacterales bacterium]|nr:hypothetical protein [Ktedonobacterales bacterium]